MAQPTEEQIRKRAFELWEQAGKPEGRLVMRKVEVISLCNQVS